MQSKKSPSAVKIHQIKKINGQEIWASSEGLKSVPENAAEASPQLVIEKKPVTAESKKVPEKIVISLVEFNKNNQNRSKENLEKGKQRY